MTPSTPPGDPTGTIDVRDPRALRALAHPLRGKLLGLLRLEGPSTATLLARRLGETSGATSYHLRQLAAYGFVEDVPGEGTGRERWWRARHRSTHFESRNFLAEPGGREVLEEVGYQQISQHSRLLATFSEEIEGLDDAWRAEASLSDLVFRLSPSQARALINDLTAVLARWQDAEETQDRGADDQQLVTVLVDVFPLKNYPL